MTLKVMKTIWTENGPDPTPDPELLESQARSGSITIRDWGSGWTSSRIQHFSNPVRLPVPLIQNIPVFFRIPYLPPGTARYFSSFRAMQQTKWRLIRSRQEQVKSYKEVCSPVIERCRFLFTEIRPATRYRHRYYIFACSLHYACFCYVTGIASPKGSILIPTCPHNNAVDFPDKNVNYWDWNKCQAIVSYR
jgi:hypothetical protein